MDNLNATIQQALKEGKYHPTREGNKLNGYKPRPKQIVIYEDTSCGVVLKAPNGVGDYLVELTNGVRVRQNIINGNVKGFIDVDEV